jgi:predicted N-acetyltransferase YhbS
MSVVSPGRCPYHVRALRGDAEVDRWLDFVASCFAFKGVSRAHFATHFYADPWRDARAVLVAETLDGELVATLRIFDRRIYAMDGRVVRAGGIGEVCTREDWQRQGLCRELLRHARGIMRDHGMSLSCLHTSTMAAVYRRCGFQAIPEYRVLVRVSLRRQPSRDWLRRGDDKRWMRVQRVDLPLGGSCPTVKGLMAQHAQYHRGRFCGAVVRDCEEYWSAYASASMAAESSLPLGAWWLQDGGSDSLPSPAHGAAGVYGFLLLKADHSGTCLRMGDFSASEEQVREDGGRVVLETILGHALGVADDHAHGIGQDAAAEGRTVEMQGGGSHEERELLLWMPRPVADSMGYCRDGGQVVEEEEHLGSMYMALDGVFSC